MLPDLAVDPPDHFEGLPVETTDNVVANGAERVEAFGPGPLRFFFLPVPCGHVIETHEAGDPPHRLRLRRVPQPRADDDPDFRLVLDVSGESRQHDGLARPNQGARRLQK